MSKPPESRPPLPETITVEEQAQVAGQPRRAGDQRKPGEHDEIDAVRDHIRAMLAEDPAKWEPEAKSAALTKLDEMMFWLRAARERAELASAR